MPSRRLPESIAPNPLSLALDALRARGEPVIDLTVSNPTRVSIEYPDGMLAPLAASAGLDYDPQPFGLAEARAAVAADHARRGAHVDPAQVVLTASTSEAYSWLFKLLCDPGEAVLVPQPSYPLFEHLATLEAIRLRPYCLEYDGRWAIDLDSIRTAPPDVRAIVAVSPNNPTGSFLAAGEHEALCEACARLDCALIVDEVFADYPLEADSPRTDWAAEANVLSFSLGGLSKTVGLPQLKLAWIAAGGPEAARARALAALELVADAYLSVSTPVQLAAGELLAAGGAVRTRIRARVRHNLGVLRTIAAEFPSCDVLRVEGGWSAIVRVPAVRSEERLVLDLLERERILVHPGYFFDFPREAFLVVSLLPAPDVFAGALPRLLRLASC